MLSPEQVAVMKSCLNIPWNLFREMRRWLASFKVSMAPEELPRKVREAWVGEGLRTDEIPVTVAKSGRTFVILRPWCYIYNLVGYVLKYLDDLDDSGLSYSHDFIPDNEIWLKVGGDHGGESFKMAFQIANVQDPNAPENTVISSIMEANVQHPNAPENTVIFSIMEAKDYQGNLRLCLERFRTHISHFNKVTWRGKKFQIILSGDYSFLCDMYGISGASGRHCCLLCQISSDYMQISRLTRNANMSESRTLISLQLNYANFVEKYNKNLKKALCVFNVII